MAGAIAGLSAGLVFASLHAIIIVPIWDRMYGSLFGASLVGSIVGWAYAELMGDDSRAIRPGRGALFGALLWLAVVPVTLTDAALRQMTRRNEMLEVVVAVGLALLVGGVWGRLRTGHWRGTIAGAAAVFALTLVMGGPVPIANSVWALGIFFAVLPACVVAGVLLGTTLGLLRARAVVAP
jgi:hypothetical protein